MIADHPCGRFRRLRMIAPMSVCQGFCRPRPGKGAQTAHPHLFVAGLRDIGEERLSSGDRRISGIPRSSTTNWHDSCFTVRYGNNIYWMGGSCSVLFDRTLHTHAKGVEGLASGRIGHGPDVQAGTHRRKEAFFLIVAHPRSR